MRATSQHTRIGASVAALAAARPAAAARRAARGASATPPRAAPRAAAPPPAAAPAAATPVPTTPATSKLAVVWVAAEVAPWSSTGGLGQVSGGLPEELAARGHKVMTVAPRYDQYATCWDTAVSVDVGGGETVRFFHEVRKGVDRVFVDHPSFLAKVWGKTGSRLYGSEAGVDFADNQARFALFCRAALAAITALPCSPGAESAVVVANDWHSALVPVLLKHVEQPAGRLTGVKVVSCLHNASFQGRFPRAAFAVLGLPVAAAAGFAFADGDPRTFAEGEPDPGPAPAGAKFEKINWLKAGVLASDRVVTVSPTYARELTAGPDKGVELEGVFASLPSGPIEGIVNGSDVATWSPAADRHLDVPYGAATVAAGKAAAKEALQAELGLTVDASAPLIGYVGRLEDQKGVDLLLAALPALAPGVQVVVLGTGKKTIEAAVEAAAAAAPGRVAAAVRFDTPLAHRLFAGADFIAVPSRFEPCGLIQLQAMAYGAVPVVASVGGLLDTVAEGVTGYHIGALAPGGLTADDVAAVAATLNRAASAYSTPAHAPMRDRCIATDVSWAGPAAKWEAVLQEVVGGAGAVGAAGRKAAVKTPVELTA